MPEYVDVLSQPGDNHHQLLLTHAQCKVRPMCAHLHALILMFWKCTWKRHGSLHFWLSFYKTTNRTLDNQCLRATLPRDVNLLSGLIKHKIEWPAWGHAHRASIPKNLNTLCIIYWESPIFLKKPGQMGPVRWPLKRYSSRNLPPALL